MKSMRLRNIKAFTDTGDIEIAPITLFVGQNSCGKSSFIRFPVVLSQSPRIPLRLHGSNSEDIDYGNYDDVLHNHSGDGFTVDLSYIIRYAERPECPVIVNNNLISDVKVEKLHTRISITYRKNRDNDQVNVSQYSIFIDGNEMMTYQNVSDQDKCIVSYKNYLSNYRLVQCDYTVTTEPDMWSSKLPRIIPGNNALKAYLMENGNIDEDHATAVIERLRMEMRYKQTFSILEDFYEPIDKDIVRLSLSYIEHPFSDEQIQSIHEFLLAEYSMDYILDILSRKLDSDFRNLEYIGPFRNDPERIYRREETVTRTVGRKGANAVNILINSSETKDKLILDAVSSWFKQSFGYSLIIDKVGKGYYQVVLQDEKNNDNLIDVGYGFSQILPIATQIAVLMCSEKTTRMPPFAYDRRHFVENKKILVIEQPELHLHPNAQAELASLFVSAINQEDIDKRTILIETHSEHLIRALQIKVADPDCFLTSEMIKIYYVDKGESGASNIFEMKMDEYGQFTEEWPSGFFDKAYSLSRELMKAVNERKKNEKRA